MRYVCMTIRGGYVRLKPDLFGRQVLAADGTGVGDDSIFERVEQGENRVALRSLLGGYLQANPDGYVGLNPAIGDWETFTEVWWPDDRISLRTHLGTFFCAEGGGGEWIVINRPEAGDWEKFYYEVPPEELLPPEPPAQQERGSPAVEATQLNRDLGGLVTDDRGDTDVDLTRRFPFP
jgi:hypothetical protein